MNNIPIKNIYYIVLYAWDQVRNKEVLSEKNLEKIDSINEVLLDIFLTEVENLTRSGLKKEYVSNKNKSRFIKGKIDVKETVKQPNRTIVSDHDEFSLNHTLNQILKAYLLKLYYIDTRYKKRVRKLLINFDVVTTIELLPSIFNKIAYSRLTMEYRFPIEIGKILYENAIPSEKEGKLNFYDIFKDEEIMNQIFERFIYNYYRKHFSYKVARRKYYWKLKPIENSNFNLIPTMNTDIEISTPNEHIIIDAKYYNNAFSENFNNSKFKSEHIYQISAYISQQSSQMKQVKGILMYPSNGYDFFEQYLTNENNIIGFKTINLTKPWECIERDLSLIFSEF